MVNTSGYAGVVLETVPVFVYASGSSGFVSTYLSTPKPTFLQYVEYHAISGDTVSSALTVYKNTTQYSSILLSQNLYGVRDLLYTPPTTPLMLLSGDSIAVRGGTSSVQWSTLIVTGR
jgi:hypothetical protein